MKNFIQKLLAGALMAGFVGAAQALPITDTYTPPGGQVTLVTGVTYTYQHSLLGFGFDPLTDILGGATLSFALTGPSGQPISILLDSIASYTGTLGELGFLTIDLASLQNDGLLNVSLTKGGGGGSTFSFSGSTLTARGLTIENPDDPTSVPEPGTLALLGLGLLGGVLVRRRKA